MPVFLGALACFALLLLFQFLGNEKIARIIFIIGASLIFVGAVLGVWIFVANVRELFKMRR